MVAKLWAQRSHKASPEPASKTRPKASNSGPFNTAKAALLATVSGALMVAGMFGAAWFVGVLGEGSRSAQNISSCWSRQRSLLDNVAPASRQKKSPLWVRMQWDEEATLWTIYTRANQRAVDRQRVKQARTTIANDIARAFTQREKHATNDIPGLVARVDELRIQLGITASEAKQKNLTRTLDIYERELKRALVEQRFTMICKTAANAALDTRARNP